MYFLFYIKQCWLFVELLETAYSLHVRTLIFSEESTDEHPGGRARGQGHGATAASSWSTRELKTEEPKTEELWLVSENWSYWLITRYGAIPFVIYSFVMCLLSSSYLFWMFCTWHVFFQGDVRQESRKKDFEVTSHVVLGRVCSWAVDHCS
jgi:hypothetical protein